MTDTQNQREMAALTARVAALEAAAEAQQSTAPETGAPGDAGSDTFWALAGLKKRLPEPAQAEQGAGAVMMVGAVRLPDGTPVEWQLGAEAAGLLEGDWADLAPAFAALAHPVRLELLRLVLNGARTTAALAAQEQLGSTGQLHHHLRQLITAGWLHQSGRGVYEVPPARVVPLLVLLVGARR